MRGIRVTSPLRTLLDFAATEPPGELEAACAAALHLGRVRRSEVESAVVSAPARAGAASLRRVIARDLRRTRSGAERELLRLIRDAELPPPQTNIRVCGWEVDLLWEEQRLAVEVDAYGTHGGRGSFERDRRRDADLQAAGIRSMRFSTSRIRHAPMAVVARLAASLA